LPYIRQNPGSAPLNQRVTTGQTTTNASTNVSTSGTTAITGDSSFEVSSLLARVQELSRQNEEAVAALNEERNLRFVKEGEATHLRKEMEKVCFFFSDIYLASPCTHAFVITFFLVRLPIPLQRFL
jgi:hypothetical protein